MKEWNSIVYAKWDGCKTFGAFSLKDGCQVGLVYASLVKDSDKVRTALQKLADNHKDCHLQFQLRQGDKVIFQTK